MTWSPSAPARCGTPAPGPRPAAPSRCCRCSGSRWPASRSPRRVVLREEIGARVGQPPNAGHTGRPSRAVLQPQAGFVLVPDREPSVAETGPTDVRPGPLTPGGDHRGGRDAAHHGQRRHRQDEHLRWFPDAAQTAAFRPVSGCDARRQRVAVVGSESPGLPVHWRRVAIRGRSSVLQFFGGFPHPVRIGGLAPHTERKLAFGPAPRRGGPSPQNWGHLLPLITATSSAYRKYSHSTKKIHILRQGSDEWSLLRLRPVGLVILNASMRSTVLQHYPANKLMVSTGCCATLRDRSLFHPGFPTLSDPPQIGGASQPH